MPWPPARTTTCPIRSSPPWPSCVKAGGFARRCGRTERSPFTTAAESTKRPTRRTEAQLFLALFQVLVLRVLAVGGAGLFGLVVRQRRQRIGVVLDFGFRRVLAVQAELLVEPL